MYFFQNEEVGFENALSLIKFGFNWRMSVNRVRQFVQLGSAIFVETLILLLFVIKFVIIACVNMKVFFVA